MSDLPPSKGIIDPAGGWKDQTYYVVDVAFRSTNPVHRRVLYVGFMPEGANCNGTPNNRPLAGAYTCLLRDSSGEDGALCDVYYLKPVCEITEMKESP